MVVMTRYSVLAEGTIFQSRILICVMRVDPRREPVWPGGKALGR